MDEIKWLKWEKDGKDIPKIRCNGNYICSYQ